MDETLYRSVEVRVRYSETDQMRVAYHSHYLVWCDVARTDYLRQAGLSYRRLEDEGLRLAVVEANLRYKAAARFDDQLRVHCWVRELRSRTIQFGYWVEKMEDGACLATATTTLIALNTNHAVSKLPAEIKDWLRPAPDPVRV